MERHAAAPEEYDLQWVLQIITRVVKQHVTEPASGYDADGHVKHEVGNLLPSPTRMRFAGAIDAQPITSDKSDQIHQSVPMHLHRAELDRYRIDIGMLEHMPNSTSFGSAAG